MRLRQNHEWYSPISKNALLESEFETILKQNSEVFAPACWIVPFRPTVYADGSSARPDFAIVDKDYSRWFVVEVEMGRHSLIGHVLPQVRTLRDAIYSQEHAALLASREPEIDLARLSDLFRGESPTIVVLVDRIEPEWERVLLGADVAMIAIELFRSERLRFILAVDGGLPERASGLVTHATHDPLLPRFLKVHSPAGLNLGHGERLEAMWEGSLTAWSRVNIENDCFLRSHSPVKLRGGVQYSLVTHEEAGFVWVSRVLKEV